MTQDEHASFTCENTDSTPFVESCRDILRQVFGFEAFRQGQEQALEGVGAGRDTLVIMPTGSGKSLCYQVPALALPGTTLVVSPLIALMKDQVDGLTLRGASVTFINSSLSTTEQLERLDALREGKFKLVYVAPERFRSRSFLRALQAVNISLLAVDEAHCISSWGHDFRPDYRRLRSVRERLEGVPTIALTATATPEVQSDIERELHMENPARVVTGFDRPNLSYRAEAIRGGTRKNEALTAVVRRCLRENEEEGIPAGIIYTGTRRHAEEVATLLEGSAGLFEGSAGRDLPKRRGPRCKAYHAGLAPDERREVQEDFMEGRLPWVAATNAFGMGVDKSDIRFVVHYDLPGSVEAYYQEVGRAGRDGQPAECVLLFSEGDRRLQEFFIEGSNPSRAMIESVHAYLWGLGENPIFRSLGDLQELYEITCALGERPNPLAFRSSIVILERVDALERLDHSENLAEVTPCDDREWSVAPYPASAKVKHAVWRGLQNVFERNEGESAGILLEQWSRELDLASDSVRRGLQALEEDGWIRYIPPFRGRAIRLPPAQNSLASLGLDFKALAEKRRREEEQLERVLAFARSFKCRRDEILTHFGETLPEEPCGHCDNCTHNATTDGETIVVRPLNEEETLTVRKILSGVARTQGRCGRNKLIQMLRGSRAQPMKDLGFEQLSTYGILGRQTKEVLGDFIDQLERAGCVRQTGDRFPLIFLTEKGREVMVEQETLQLPLPHGVLKASAHRGGQAAGRSSGAAEEDGEFDNDLYQSLRHLRREIAGRLSVPAFRIFSDRTLKAMARDRPRTGDALLALPGVGSVTLERFGDEFLREINQS